MSDSYGNLRFWAGAGWSNSQTAPFRVYDDGRVFGTQFYGFQSAIIITSSNKTQYLTNGCIDLRKTGNRIYLDSSLVTKTSGAVSFLLVPDFLFPTNVENYIGSEIVIINPHQVPIAKSGQILNQSVAPEDLYANNTSLTLYTSSYATASGEFKQRVIMLQSGDTVVSTMPSGSNYTPEFSRFQNGTIATSNTRFVSKYAVQIYRLNATPYIRFPNGKKGNHLKEFGSSKTVGGYIYQRYAFWALEKEIYQLAIQESY